MVGSRVYNIFP